MSKNKKPTKWMKLDNAALIYPATMNRCWTALFRLSATLRAMLALILRRNHASCRMQQGPNSCPNASS